MKIKEGESLGRWNSGKSREGNRIHLGSKRGDSQR
jgi:hypothetical protein